MTPRRLTLFLLILALALGTAGAADRVVVEPDRQVRPGVTVPVWGMAGNGGPIGDGSANGEAYTFAFGPNPNVTVNDDGNLSGTVGNDRFIAENVSFTLLGGSCRELVTATLTVGGQPSSNTVTFDIVDSCSAISDTALKALAVDTNIGIADAARCLLQKQLADGSFNADGSGYGSQDGATTGFAIWALENSGHLPTGDANQDVYVDFVKQGLGYLQGTGTNQGTVATNADVARQATAAGVSDLNSNGISVRLASSDTWRGYSHPIATAAFIASLDTASYQTLVEDAIDFIGVMQNAGAFGRGGWDYNGPSSRSDNSINSWIWMALEGGEATSFGIDAPDWILAESEYTLNSHQTNAAGSQPFGYTGTGPLRGATNGQATTCGGLSGLAAAQLQNVVLPGSIIATNGAPLNTIVNKRQAAIDYMGDNWNITANADDLGRANKGNFYAMWTCCRAFRLTESATGVPVTLNNGGVPFDWETGEENPPSGILAAAGTAREGYVPFLLRNQDADGCWNEGTYIGGTLETAMGLLCLNPTVFGPPRREPRFVQAQLACGSTVVVEANSALSFLISASDNDAGDIVTLDVMNLPAGATMTPPLPTAGNPVSSTFDWTPTDADIGNYLVTFKATDTDQNETTCDVELEVGEGGPLLVELASFEVLPGDGRVTVNWETALEIDNQGFYIWRRDLLSNELEKVSGFIPATAVNNSGASYSFTDEAALNGVQYFYFLEDLDLSGESTTHSGVSVVANPQHPPIRLLAPAYGATVPGDAALTLSFEADASGRYTVAVSPDPSFENPSLMLRARGNEAVIRSSLLKRAAAAPNATVYWGVLDQNGNLASQVWRFAVDLYDAHEVAPPADEGRGLRPARQWRTK